MKVKKLRISAMTFLISCSVLSAENSEIVSSLPGSQLLKATETETHESRSLLRAAPMVVGPDGLPLFPLPAGGPPNGASMSIDNGAYPLPVRPGAYPSGAVPPPGGAAPGAPADAAAIITTVVTLGGLIL